MVSNTNYVAGTTFDLSLTLTLDQNDLEYGDQLTITFPNSVTVNSTTNTPDLGPDDGGASSDGPEAYVGITGQTITWGNDDNTYGGIVPGQAYPITINVSVAAGTTGPITVNYHVDGDQYQNAQDFDGTFDILEQQNVNAKVIGGGLYDLTANNFVSNGCGLTSGNMLLIVKNDGGNALTVGTVGDSLTYYVNNAATKTTVGATGVSAVVDFNTGNPLTSIASGDTAVVIVLNPAVDLSTVGNYDIYAVLNLVGSGDGNASDDSLANFNITHIATSVIDVANYTEDFENGGVLGAYFSGEDVDGGGFNIFDTPTGYNGSTAALWFFENNVNVASEDWAFSPCMDLTAGNTYYVKCFARLTTNYNGTLSYALSSDQTSAGVAQTIGTHATLTANSTWTRDSVSFIASATGTYYLGLKAQNTDATKSLSLRVDNITVGLVPSSVGIKNNVSSDAISIFPNPNNGVFTVKVSENEASMEVYSIIGENVYSSKVVKGNNTVDLSNLAAGSYIVKVNNGGKSTAKRIVINK